MDNGIFIRGIYCGGVEQVKDGKVSYQYLVTDGGAVSYRVKCDENLLGKVAFGDLIEFKVRVNAFNGSVYFNGTCVSQ